MGQLVNIDDGSLNKRNHAFSILSSCALIEAAVAIDVIARNVEFPYDVASAFEGPRSEKDHHSWLKELQPTLQMGIDTV